MIYISYSLESNESLIYLKERLEALLSSPPVDPSLKKKKKKKKIPSLFQFISLFLLKCGSLLSLFLLFPFKKNSYNLLLYLVFI